LTYAGSLENLATVIDNPMHVFVRADICDRAAMARVIGEHRPQTLYHLAAESHVDRSIDTPLGFVETNVLGTAILLDAALDYCPRLGSAGRRTSRFVHVSPDEVYGELGRSGYSDDASRYRPNSPYSASKAGADHLARAWYRSFGLPVVISNC